MAVFDPITPDEIWYPVPGFPGYEFSSEWRLRSFHFRGPGGGIRRDRWTLKKSRPNAAGYPRYLLARDGKSHVLYLHHLVARLAYGSCPDGLEVLHFDDDKSNAYPSNLSYGTRSLNMLDGFRTGSHPRGEVRTQAKLSDSDVREIRRLCAEGVRQRDVAVRFGIGQGLVSRIVSRLRWGHVV